ncbi:fimbrial protein [Achromobacter arsenitoxydans]|uniref:Major fimbrial subunit protein n=1 Tax=Achromobacter arsenitoxydans SY8 TaxID=477184 RepID=H0F1Y3_9BURK|nr:fimbrial protein [Achromobacter arsenitoxydans]EHK67709.1 major fimbrial subunit protein [Achromobacter arsenitoxydans SY8]
MNASFFRLRQCGALAAGLLAMALSSGGAGAASEAVNLRFIGRYVPLSCYIREASIDVALPTVSTQSLSSPGDVAGSTRFDIPIECEGAPGQVRAYFEAGPTTDASGRLNPLDMSPAPTPSGVQIELLNGDGTVIRVGDRTSVKVVNITEGVATLNMPFYARYYGSGGATPGVVRTYVTYVLDIP